MNRVESMIKPFLKWAGGKGKIVEEIVQFIEEDGREWFPSENNRYFEPFFGGGALCFHLLNSGIISAKSARISDLEPSLVNAMKVLSVGRHRKELIKNLKNLEKEYHKFQENHGMTASDDSTRKNRMYYQKRELLKAYQRNKPNTVSDKIDWAALTIFVNKTCFNGLWRVNSAREFNVPEGRYKKPKICNSELLNSVGDVFSKFSEIENESYKEALKNVKSGDLVYLDPPYMPLKVGDYVFKDYTEEPFDEEQQEELATYAAQLVSRGARVIASNNYLEEKLEQIYIKAAKQQNIPPPKFLTIPITRTMSSVGKDRVEIAEVLILMHPDSISANN